MRKEKLCEQKKGVKKICKKKNCVNIKGVKKGVKRKIV